MSDLSRSVENLRKQGVILPRNTSRAAQQASEMRAMVEKRGALADDVRGIDQLDRFATRQGMSPEVAEMSRNNAALINEMGRSRRIGSMRRTAQSQDVTIAIPRFYDPLEYWDLSGLPWNMADEGHRHKLHKWLRLYYATHWLVPILIDIFTRFPLIGLHLYSKDKKITEFYEDLFLNELQYEDFLVNLGREYWTVGEAFPLGSFNESLGVWEREELLNPEDIIIENFPLLGTRQIKVVPPEYMKRLVTSKSPPDQYRQLEINFPELIPYLRRGEPFPVSEVLLKQVAFKVTDWDDHGTPMLLRGLRVLLHQEKLLASQDAIAERLYSPLILAKLGINNVGDNEGPWIPGPDQLEAFRDDMDMALSSDFRLMVYHYALEVENVFGREQVPDLWNDFEMVDTWLMQIFGLQGILKTGANASPYATSALNAEFMNQILRTFQKYMKEHMRMRMEVVAEAQEHYDYEKRGETRVPIMEEVVEWDDDGEPHIVEKHKLLTPDVEMESLDLRDESTERMFLQSLRSMGVPISDERLMVGITFDYKDSLDEMQEEMIQKTVAQQMAKLQTYKILKAQSLSIPPDLKAEIEGGQPGGAAGGGPGGGPGGPPGMGGGGPMGGGGAPPLGIGAPAPMGGGMVMPPVPPGLGALPTGPAGGPGARPQISNERMQGMPRPGGPTPGIAPRSSVSIREDVPEIAEQIYVVSAEEVSEQEIDERLERCAAVISDIEFRKRMRRTSSEQRKARQFEIEDAEQLKWSSTEKITIDRVPPMLRREILNSN